MRFWAIVITTFILLGSGLLVLQFGGCTEQGSDQFIVVGQDIYRHKIYAESGNTLSIDWKSDHGIWAWYTDPTGNAFPAVTYCFGNSGEIVRGIAEPGIAYEEKPALEMEDERGNFLYYLPMIPAKERTTVIEVETDGYYSICFMLSFYPDDIVTNINVNYTLTKPVN